jgi:transcriptional regulator
MFVPKRFAVDDLAALDALLARDAFVTLVSQVDDAPFASHLPVLYRREGNAVRFRGHWARANPQWRGIEAQTVLLIAHGPHAYVSPSWYASPGSSVPTWNYTVAHVHGAVTLIEHEQALAGLVAALAAHYEAAIGSDWRFPDSAPGTRAELAGIVGFELVAERIAIKHKLNQHHDDASRAGAVRGLRGRGDPGSLEIADLMATARAAGRGAAASVDPASPPSGLPSPSP